MIALRLVFLLAIALWASTLRAQQIEPLPAVVDQRSAQVSGPEILAQPVPSLLQPRPALPISAAPESQPATAFLNESRDNPIQQIAALQQAPRDRDAERTQAEQRIRELEGLGPAPGTSSADENRAAGSVPSKPTVAWTGEIQADTVMPSQSQANIAELGQLRAFSDFRRARLGAIGSLWANTIYRIEVDFALQGRPTFLDIYGQFTDLAILGNLRIGHFFEPFAISRLTSNRYQSFMERPLLDAFAPARNLGVMAFDTYAEKHGTWQLGLFAANSNDDAEEQTNRGGEAVTGRMTYLPYWDELSDGRYYMHVGGCFSYRVPAQQQARFGYWPGFRPGAFDNIVWPLWADTGVINVNDVTLLDLEWAWVMGPVHVQAEYAANLINQIGGPNLSFNAWYVEAGWFLTGESRPYLQEMAIFNRVTPFEPFFFTRTKDGICRGRGALQLAARIDDLDVSNNNIQGGRLRDLTFALNWYLNPYTRMEFNYVHAILTRGQPGNSYGNLFGMRAQFEF